MKDIHYIGWASQPYVQFHCTEEQHYVSVGVEEGLPKEVYRCDGGLYTFDPHKTTCVECRVKVVKETPEYKACRQCAKWRAEENFGLAVRCNSCKGTGAVRDHLSYVCNGCGGSMSPGPECDDRSPHGLVEASVGGGYNSYHLTDCTTYIFSLCEKCLRGAFTNFRVPPTVINRLGDSHEGPETAYEQDLDYYLHREWVRLGGQKEAFEKGLCTHRKQCGKPARWAVMHDATHVSGRAVCDEHLPHSLNAVSNRCVPVEAVVKRPSLKSEFADMREAWDKAPNQFPTRTHSDEKLGQLCEEALGINWSVWSETKLPASMMGKTPKELIAEGYVYWVYTLIQVFAQRGEIPYYSPPAG